MATHALQPFDHKPLAHARADLIDRRAAVAGPAHRRAPETPGGYRPDTRAGRRAAIIVLALHALAIAAIVSHRISVSPEKPPEAIELLAIPEAARPQTEKPELRIETPPPVVPPPLFEIENPPAITAIVADPPVASIGSRTNAASFGSSAGSLL